MRGHWAGAEVRLLENDEGQAGEEGDVLARLSKPSADAYSLLLKQVRDCAQHLPRARKSNGMRIGVSVGIHLEQRRIQYIHRRRHDKCSARRRCLYILIPGVIPTLLVSAIHVG